MTNFFMIDFILSQIYINCLWNTYFCLGQSLLLNQFTVSIFPLVHLVHVVTIYLLYLHIMKGFFYELLFGIFCESSS